MASTALTHTVLPPALEASWLNEEKDRSFQNFKKRLYKVDDLSHVSLSEYTVDASLASNTRCVYLTCLDVPTQGKDTFFAYLDAKQQRLASRLAAAETSKSVRAILRNDMTAFNHVRGRWCSRATGATTILHTASGALRVSTERVDVRPRLPP